MAGDVRGSAVEFYRAAGMDAKHTLGEPRALISRTALLHNLSLIRRELPPRAQVCAILKADAYGHGAELVADTLCHFSDGRSSIPAVDAIAVASVDEAYAIAPLPVPILIFRPVENAFIGRQRAKIETAVREQWTLTLCSAAAADDVARIALAAKKRASVQVMVDTGMTRCGVSIDHLEQLLTRIESHASLRLTTLCTHFSAAEEAENPFTMEQLVRFRDATDAYAAARKIPRHAANSGAIFFSPETHLDMVRPGISLYGVDPTGRPNLDRPLRPVLRWTAPLLHVRDVPAGTPVGYGMTWKTSEATRIGLVPVGYADGFARQNSNRAVMMLHGRPAPVVGRVSMDMVTLDLKNHPHAVVGDEVTVLDDDPLSPASVYVLAERMQTVPYEILCRIGSRIARVAKETDDPGGATTIAEADEAD